MSPPATGVQGDPPGCPARSVAERRAVESRGPTPGDRVWGLDGLRLLPLRSGEVLDGLLVDDVERDDVLLDGGRVLVDELLGLFHDLRGDRLRVLGDRDVVRPAL